MYIELKCVNFEDTNRFQITMHDFLVVDELHPTTNAHDNLETNRVETNASNKYHT